MARSPFTVNVREAPAYVSVGELVTLLASAEQTGGLFGLMEGVLAKALSPHPTSTTGRTSRSSSSRDPWSFVSATRSSLPRPVHSSSARATYPTPADTGERAGADVDPGDPRRTGVVLRRAR
jgi:hypothetical protein